MDSGPFQARARGYDPGSCANIDDPLEYSKDDSTFDLADMSIDSVSTCAPSSSVSSMHGTPESGPSDLPEELASLVSLSLFPVQATSVKPGHFEVCIVHHDDMQLHVPPNTETVAHQFQGEVGDVLELPRRVIAIENCLKCLPICRGFPRRQMFGDPLQFLPARDGKSRKSVSAFGSASPRKRRRTSYSAGPASIGSAWNACRIVEAPFVTDADLLLVHSERHVADVVQACKLAASENASFYPMARPLDYRRRRLQEHEFNGDIYYSPNSLAAFKRAAGGAVEAVRQMFSIDSATGRATGRSSIGASFAIVRPPGHHCCDNPNGFCYFNNTAIAAAHARAVLGLSRVAIVDWDYHHGDGTQTAFYRDPSVLTISLHVALVNGDFAFPGVRGMDLECNGQGLGRGYNINIPWPHDRVGAKEYDEAFQTVVVPALQGFDPELILVAAGFDATDGDLLAGTKLPTRSYHDMTRQLLALGKPLAVILEGGYSPELLATSSLNVVHALLGRPPPACKDIPRDLQEYLHEGGVEKVDELDASVVLDVVRRRLNTLPPWSNLASSNKVFYFHEESSKEASMTANTVACKLRDIFKQLLEDPA